MKSIAFIISLLVTTAYAAELTIDFDHCYSGSLPLIHDNEKTMAFHWESVGIIVADDDRFKDATSNCLGMTWNTEDKEDFSKAKRQAFCIFKLANGDWLMNNQVYDNGWTWTIADGTGQFEGATGSGTLTNKLFSYPGARGGETFQGCSKYTGTLTLK